MRRPLAVVALAAACVLGGCGGEPDRAGSTLPKPPPGVPEGGSNLGSDVRADERGRARERSLLGALSSLLELRAPGATDGPRVRGPVRSARELAARLPRSRAAAQVLLAGFDGLDASGIGDLDLGAVALEARNYSGDGQLAALTGGLRAAAQTRGHLPPLVALAADFPLTPLGRTVEAVRTAALADGQRFAALGADLVLGPVADLDAENGFGDDPRTVAPLVRTAVQAYAEGGLLAAPRHFPGQGGATQDPLRGPAVVAGDVGRTVGAFATAERALVVSNAAFAAWDSVTPAVHAPEAMAVLRGELRFRGVAIADNVLGAAAASGTSPGAAAVAALRNGCDMVYVRDADERIQAHRAILAALRRGELADDRLREAVARVLELKAAAGVLGAG